MSGLDALQPVTVATFSTELEAMMMRELLEGEGIPCLTVPLGAGVGAFGSAAMMPHELRVPARDSARAREILEALSSEGDPV